jgi:hypothetical protein
MLASQVHPVKRKCKGCACDVLHVLHQCAGLFAAPGGQPRRLRELIVDLAAPLSGASAQAADAELPAASCAAAEEEEEGGEGALNAEQREAVDR